MKHQEHPPKIRTAKTGPFATLANLPSVKGAGAPSSRLIVSLVLVITGLLALTAAAPALAGEAHVFANNFGEPGNGPGQLQLAENSGLAVNAESGNVYVADTGNGRLAEFTAAGAFIRNFGSISHPSFIAIDNSGGPSKGDVYVADTTTNSVFKFLPDGTPVLGWGTAGQLQGSPPFTEVIGIAVSAAGQLFVLDDRQMDVFAESGTFVRSFTVKYPAAQRGFALDTSEGTTSGYIFTRYRSGPETLKYDANGSFLGEPDLQGTTGLAVDPVNGDLYVDHGADVSRYEGAPGGQNPLLETIGSSAPPGGALNSAQGVTVGPGHAIYVANSGSSNIAVFTLQNVDPPLATIGTASEVSYTGAHVSGTVDPEGFPTTCRLEYVTKAHFEAEGFSGAESSPCASDPGSGTTPEAVEGDLSGLHPSTIYHVRLTATNPGGTGSSPEPNITLETKAVAAPSVSIDAPTEVDYTTAMFSGHINPNAPAGNPAAFDVRWHFQCTPECPGVEGEVAADGASHEVSIQVTGLHPGTDYEVKLIAENAGGEASSEGKLFETKAVAAPSVAIDPITTFTATTAHFVGHINPNAPGAAPQNSLFDVAWGFRCTPKCPRVEGTVLADNTSHEVHADVTGLQPGTTYQVSLIAENASGETEAGPLSFTTSVVPPTIDGTFVSGATATAANLNALIKAGGAPTSYHFEYITKAEFDQDEFASPLSTPIPDAEVQAANELQSLSIVATGGVFTLEFEGETTPPIASDADAEAVQSALDSLPAIGGLGGSVAVVGGPGDPDITIANNRPFLITFQGALAGTDVDLLQLEIGALEGSGNSYSKVRTVRIGAAAAANADHQVSIHLGGLSPATSYVYRVVATNQASPSGGIAGPATTFFTYSNLPASSDCPNEIRREENNSLALPDCRAYEQVSAPEDAEVYPPIQPAGISFTQLETERLMQSSADGEAVTYAGEPAASGQGEGTGGSGLQGTGDQHLAQRSASGWTAADVAPPGRGLSPFGSSYVGFTDDLSLGVLGIAALEPQLTPGVTDQCKGSNTFLYSHSLPTGPYDTLTSGDLCAVSYFGGLSADGSHRFFESNAAMTVGAEEGFGFGHENIYENSGGQIHLVSVLPGGNATSNATIGAFGGHSYSEVTPALNASNAVSDDGSLIFWTALEGEPEQNRVETKAIYMRENPAASQECTVPGEAGKACTVQVSLGPATYQTATPDGHYAYYIEAGELWRFDTQTRSRQSLTGPGTGVQGVIGVNQTGEDGSYLYFVASASLAPDAQDLRCATALEERSEKERNGEYFELTPEEREQLANEEAIERDGRLAPGRGCNLYLLHAGTMSHVAVLGPGDNSLRPVSNGTDIRGVWSAIPGLRAAQLTPDGHSLVFTSAQPLTGYDNVNREGWCDPRIVGDPHRCAEIYLFQTQAQPAEQIACVSCAPSGAPPAFIASQPGREGIGTYLPFSLIDNIRTPRAISADGSRVFFNTAQPLVPTDTNTVQDVYEWERAGSGSCTAASPFTRGCLSILSGGQGPEYSAFLGSDETGSNAFLVSRSQLGPNDRDQKGDLYDARVDGGFLVPSERICEGESCKGPISAPPSPQSPGTATFQSNEPPPPIPCKKGKVRKRGKCVSKKPQRHKGHKHKRAANPNRRAGR